MVKNSHSSEHEPIHLCDPPLLIHTERRQGGQMNSGGIVLRILNLLLLEEDGLACRSRWPQEMYLTWGLLSRPVRLIF